MHSRNHKYIFIALAVSLTQVILISASNAAPLKTSVAPLKTRKGLVVPTTPYAPNAGINKAALDYQEFLLDTNNKLLLQLKNAKQKTNKLNGELATAQSKIDSLEGVIAGLNLQVRKLSERLPAFASEPAESTHSDKSPGSEDISAAIASEPAESPHSVIALGSEDVSPAVASKPSEKLHSDLLPGSAGFQPALTFNPIENANFVSRNGASSKSQISHPQLSLSKPKMPVTPKPTLSDYPNNTAIYLTKLQNQIAESLSDPPQGGYSGLKGKIDFEITPDGSPRFSAQSGDEFSRKARYVIAKAGPFRPFIESYSSNQIEVEVLPAADDHSAPNIRLSMLMSND